MALGYNTFSQIQVNASSPERVVVSVVAPPQGRYEVWGVLLYPRGVLDSVSQPPYPGGISCQYLGGRDAPA